MHGRNPTAGTGGVLTDMPAEDLQSHRAHRMHPLRVAARRNQAIGYWVSLRVRNWKTAASTRLGGQKTRKTLQRELCAGRVTYNTFPQPRTSASSRLDVKSTSFSKDRAPTQ